MIKLIKNYLKKKEKQREEEIEAIINDWSNL